MATFLQLCQRVHRYARVGEDAPGTAPKTVVNQEGVLAEIVGWVQDAHEDIQSDQDEWRFREAPGAVTVPAGQRDVDVAATLADYDVLRPYTASYQCPYILVGSDADGRTTVVQVVRWEDWRGGQFERADAPARTGMPQYMTVLPSGLLRLYPIPDVPVVLGFGYRRQLQPLLADNDAPIIPERHHNAIVWRALMYYADTRDRTKEPYEKWERRRKQAMQRLYRDQLPEISF